jgi:hypothetical protein
MGGGHEPRRHQDRRPSARRRQHHIEVPIVLVANTRPILPGAVMNVRPIGVRRVEDDGGDEKIIAVPSSRSWAGVASTRRAG